ncbi:MAG: hypothetical protein EOM87_09645, partial [Clostridia bacterium]|nr:hypothetical protein [Clostridia bacterium]
MYRETKIYNDGSHYIAIPPTTNKSKRGKSIKEDLITVVEEESESAAEPSSSTQIISESENISDNGAGSQSKINIKTEQIADAKPTAENEINEPEPEKKKKTVRQTTRSDIFNELFKESLDLPKSKRRKYIIDGMKKYFKFDKQTSTYVDDKLEKKSRSIMCRRIRFTRKAYMHDFNYFVTLTYSNALHT